MDFPRFALSDGTRLFVADGGNDRVLIYNTIPTQNAAAADVILGQPDEFASVVSSFTDLFHPLLAAIGGRYHADAHGAGVGRDQSVRHGSGQPSRAGVHAGRVPGSASTGSAMPPAARFSRWVRSPWAEPSPWETS